MSPLCVLCFAIFLAGTIDAVVVYYTPCEDVPQNTCTVDQVRIEPCDDPNRCKLKKGRPSSLYVGFTPNFTASELKTSIFWAHSLLDMPLINLHKIDGCNLTTCPTQTGKTQGISYNLHLSKKMPVRMYDLKWMLWNGQDDTQVCCVKTQVWLIK